MRYLFEGNKTTTDNIDGGKTPSAKPYGAADFFSKYDDQEMLGQGRGNRLDPGANGDFPRSTTPTRHSFSVIRSVPF